MLHLFKEEWSEIHEYIIARWGLINPKPKANVRAGDHKDMLNTFEEKGCEIDTLSNKYRNSKRGNNSRDTSEDYI